MTVAFHFFIFCLLAALSSAGLNAAGTSLERTPERVLTDQNGKTLRARVLSLSSGKVKLLRLRDSKVFTLPMERLSAGDQTWILDTFGKNTVEKLNRVFGQEIFRDDCLWDDQPSDVAERMGNWPLESRTTSGESYRSYPKADYTFMGTRPYSAVVRGEDDRTRSLSFVFANQGDTVSDLSEGSLDRLEEVVAKDQETISNVLTNVFGESEKLRLWNRIDQARCHAVGLERSCVSAQRV